MFWGCWPRRPPQVGTEPLPPPPVGGGSWVSYGFLMCFCMFLIPLLMHFILYS